MFSTLLKEIDETIKKQVLTSSATELVEMLDEHTVTCQEVMLCFIERTATVGVQNNYVLDEMFEEAFQKAKECDRVRKQNPDKKSWKPGMSKENCLPPFFGVPISIKESVLMKGRQSYVGFASKINPIPK